MWTSFCLVDMFPFNKTRFVLFVVKIPVFALCGDGTFFSSVLFWDAVTHKAWKVISFLEKYLLHAHAFRLTYFLSSYSFVVWAEQNLILQQWLILLEKCFSTTIQPELELDLCADTELWKRDNNSNRQFFFSFDRSYHLIRTYVEDLVYLCCHFIKQELP